MTPSHELLESLTSLKKVFLSRRSRQKNVNDEKQTETFPSLASELVEASQKNAPRVGMSEGTWNDPNIIYPYWNSLHKRQGMRKCFPSSDIIRLYLRQTRKMFIQRNIEARVKDHLSKCNVVNSHNANGE